MFSIDPIAALLAASALWVAYLAYRASCKIWIKLLSVGGAFSQSIYEPDHHYFEVVIQNLGLPLYRSSICLFFKGRDGGTYTIEMQRVEYRHPHKIVTDNGEFAQGMIGAFRLKSTKLGPGLQMLTELECPKKSDAKIRVFSQDFLVAEFRLWDRFYWFKSKWNLLAYKFNNSVNRLFIGPDSSTLINQRAPLPKFNIDSQWRLEHFVEGTVRHNPSQGTGHDNLKADGEVGKN